MLSRSANTQGRIILHIPLGAVAFSRPMPKSDASAIATPHTVAQRTVRTHAVTRLGREKRRSEPVDSEFEMRIVTAWYATVAMKVAGKIQRTGDTVMISVAKIRERVDMQREAQMRGKRG